VKPVPKNIVKSPEKSNAKKLKFTDYSVEKKTDYSNKAILPKPPQLYKAPNSNNINSTSLVVNTSASSSILARASGMILASKSMPKLQPAPSLLPKPPPLIPQPQQNSQTSWVSVCFFQFFQTIITSIEKVLSNFSKRKFQRFNLLILNLNICQVTD
jgi:hypothetical protein